MIQDARARERTGTSAVPAKPNGPVAAALLAAGWGVFAIGLMTTLAEAMAAVANALNWYGPVGPLSGKTGVGIIVWLVAWVGVGVYLPWEECRHREDDTVDVDSDWAWAPAHLPQVL